MKHSESITKLAAALVAAQTDIRAVGMDALNPHFKTKYASLDNIIETVRPTLAKHGLALVQGTTTPESDANSKVTAFTVETMLVHSSGEWLLNAIVMPVAKADPQGAGAALTYGRRYGISALLSLATDEDDDANSAARPQQQRSGVRGGTGGSPNGDTLAGGSVASPTAAGTAQSTAPLNAASFTMPIGKKRGQMLGTIDSDTLRGVVEWCEEKAFTKKYADLLAAIATVLASREAKAA